MTRKPLRDGLDFVRGDEWKPRLYTRRGAQRYADKRAAQSKPAGFWHGVVGDVGDYWVVSIGGYPVRPWEMRKEQG